MKIPILAIADRDAAVSDLWDFCAKVSATKDETDRAHLATVRRLEGLLADERATKEEAPPALAELQLEIAKSREKESPFSFFNSEEWEKRVAETRSKTVDVLTDAGEA